MHELEEFGSMNLHIYTRTHSPLKGRCFMLVAGILGMILAVAFGFVIDCVMTVFSATHRGLLYVISPRQRAMVKAARLAAQARRERIKKYGNDDPVQYGDCHCAGYGGYGCHCSWDGTNRPPCY